MLTSWIIIAAKHCHNFRSLLESVSNKFNVSNGKIKNMVTCRFLMYVIVFFFCRMEMRAYIFFVVISSLLTGVVMYA